MVSRTNDEFANVATGTKKVKDLVAEIAVASQEQAQGVDQINKAVAEMDKVVQSNAANAEESASASEELNAQAVQMKEYVEELAALIHGGGNGNEPARIASRSVTPYAKPPQRKRPANLPAVQPLKRQTRSLKGKEMSPDQVIPMGENFEEF